MGMLRGHVPTSNNRRADLLEGLAEMAHCETAASAGEGVAGEGVTCQHSTKRRSNAEVVGALTVPGCRYGG